MLYYYDFIYERNENTIRNDVFSYALEAIRSGEDYMHFSVFNPNKGIVSYSDDTYDLRYNGKTTPATRAEYDFLHFLFTDDEDVEEERLECWKKLFKHYKKHVDILSDCLKYGLKYKLINIDFIKKCGLEYIFSSGIDYNII